MIKAAVIVVAAGEGQRYGSIKQTISLKGKPVLEWCLESFEKNPGVSQIILVLRKEIKEDIFVDRFSKITDVVIGGERRQDSVEAGFQRIDPKDAEIVLVHDGVRPLISDELITRVIKAAEKHGAAAPVVPILDTVKRSDGAWILRTEDRASLYRAQTPQGFQYKILKQALDNAKNQSLEGTDDSFLVENTGNRVFLVPGDLKNLKITTPMDLKIAEVFLEN